MHKFTPHTSFLFSTFQGNPALSRSVIRTKKDGDAVDGRSPLERLQQELEGGAAKAVSSTSLPKSTAVSAPQSTREVQTPKHSIVHRNEFDMQNYTSGPESAAQASRPKVCIYKNMYVCMCIYIYLYICIHTFLCVCVCVYARMHTHIYIC